MPCTHPVYDYENGEALCGRPAVEGRADRCWHHAPETHALRSQAAKAAARTRRRRRSWWGRLLAALTFRRPAVTTTKEA